MLEKEMLRPQQGAPKNQHIKHMKNAVAGKVNWDLPEGRTKRQRIRKQKGGKLEDLRGPTLKQTQQRK